MEKLFELAARKKYRFDRNGWISIEELWEMNFTELDNTFRWLNDLKAKNNAESLIERKDNVDLDNKIEIVKYIFNQLKLEQIEKNERAEKERRRKIIEEVLEEQKKDNLYDKTEEELRQMLNDI